jgi:hypothetical protein
MMEKRERERIRAGVAMMKVGLQTRPNPTGTMFANDMEALLNECDRLETQVEELKKLLGGTL